MDDERALLESMSSYLTRLGYVVMAFLDAQVAWDSFGCRSIGELRHYRGLTLDGMSGEEFIGKALQLKPDVPVLATSGYPQALRKLHELLREC